MRKLMIAALLAGQAATPAVAADLVDTRSENVRQGAFAGARLRISLDREARERVRAGVTIAPTRHDVRSDGTARLRLGEGLEFGATERGAPALTLAGQPVRDLAAPVGPAGTSRNISTIGWVAIGVGVVAVGTAIWFFDAMADASE